MSFPFRSCFLSAYCSLVLSSRLFTLSPEIYLHRSFFFIIFIFFNVLPFSVFVSRVFSQSVYSITKPPFHYIFGILSSAFSFVPDTIIGNIFRFFYKVSPLSIFSQCFHSRVFPLQFFFARFCLHSSAYSSTIVFPSYPVFSPYFSSRDIYYFYSKLYYVFIYTFQLAFTFVYA